MTRPVWLKDGNWCEEWMGMVDVQGMFIVIGELIAMGGFWSIIDMEERDILERIGSAETP